MKKSSLILTLAAFFVAAVSLNAGTQTYQVTGPVLAVEESSITVDKGGDKWEISADGATLGSVKVGDKVTIKYQMVAKKIDIKPAQ